jgi:LL-diaminopimelate aminotransferase
MIKSAERLSNFGEYYFSRKLDEIRKMNEHGDMVLNLGIGSPDLPPPQNVIDKLKSSTDSATNHSYQSYRSIKPLREAYASFYKEHYQATLDAEKEVLPLLGSKEGVMYVSMAFLNPGDVVLIPNPGYPAYGAVATMIGAKPIYYDLDSENGWNPDFSNLDAETLEKAKILWVNFPNMPTGQDASNDIFQELVAFGKKHDILICNDNPYSFILNDNPKSILEFDEAKEHCIELNSLSKAFNMAGWRVGFVAGHEDYINAILTVKSNVDSGMFKPVQEAAIEALKMPKSWFAKINAVYGERKKSAIILLEQIGCSVEGDQVGMFVWAKIPEGNKSEIFIDEILQQSRVFITPGTIFGSNGEGYVRVSLCSTEADFNRSIERIEKTMLINN